MDKIVNNATSAIGRIGSGRFAHENSRPIGRTWPLLGLTGQVENNMSSYFNGNVSVCKIFTFEIISRHDHSFTGFYTAAGYFRRVVLADIISL